VYLDYEQQELAIAGYLSGDKKLIEAYNSGCGYLQTAKWLGMVPEYATKETHPEERDQVKILFFALNYGAGPRYVAQNLGITLLKANHVLTRFKQLYKVYVSWIAGVLKSVAMTNRITTRLGWQRHSNGSFKLDKDGKAKSIRNTLLNFPMQGNGSDILRQAIIKLHEANFEVVAPVHDAVLVQIPLGDHEARIKEAQNIMVEASAFVIGGPIRVGKEVIYSNWQQKEKDQKFFNEIFNEISTYCKNGIQPTPNLV
jgi:DNA polymerase I-like protein with 3'-5' exonuclease and polymerase domains